MPFNISDAILVKRAAFSESYNELEQTLVLKIGRLNMPWDTDKFISVQTWELFD